MSLPGTAGPTKIFVKSPCLVSSFNPNWECNQKVSEIGYHLMKLDITAQDLQRSDFNKT
jgi:hypothetical protein